VRLERNGPIVVREYKSAFKSGNCSDIPTSNIYLNLHDLVNFYLLPHFLIGTSGKNPSLSNVKIIHFAGFAV
jgi:hypothetical protein